MMDEAGQLYPVLLHVVAYSLAALSAVSIGWLAHRLTRRRAVRAGSTIGKATEKLEAGWLEATQRKNSQVGS